MYITPKKEMKKDSKKETDSVIVGTRKNSETKPVPKPIAMTKTIRAGRSFLIPPQSEKYRGKKTLILDLDETLLHSSTTRCENPDLVITVIYNDL